MTYLTHVVRPCRIYLFTLAYPDRKPTPLLFCKLSYMADSSESPRVFSQEVFPPRAADEVVQREDPNPDSSSTSGSESDSDSDSGSDSSPLVRHGGGKGPIIPPPRQ